MKIVQVEPTFNKLVTVCEASNRISLYSKWNKRRNVFYSNDDYEVIQDITPACDEAKILVKRSYWYYDYYYVIN